MGDQKSILKSTIIQYGLIYGGLAVVFSIMLFIMDMHYQGGSLQQWTGFIIMVGSITFAQIAYRKLNDGYLNLSEAIKIGLGVTLIGILIALVYGWFQATILDPNQIEKATEFAINQAIDQNPEMTDEMVAMTREWIEWGSSPVISSAFALGFGLLFGLIVSLITGLIFKKSKTN
tara:strand:+ start:455 stop:979 length:525 start_codon:yes stop_codon:yes gene_type:complete